MIVGRQQILDMALSIVRSNQSLDIVGGRGSGRTAFLATLGDRLTEEGWSVTTIRGIASLKQHPLAALQLSNASGDTPSRGATGLQGAAAGLLSRVSEKRTAIFVDDWDDLDESSWGVIESVRRSSGVPLVLSRLQGLQARHTPSGLPASTLEPTYVIDMAPLRLEEMENALQDHLGASIETGTMNLIYAKSGGSIGLAISLVDAVVREGHLIRGLGGSWTSSGELWSSGLRAVLETHLEGLPAEARDALEIIAMVGAADIETVKKLVSWETLELLEERALVAIVPSAPRTLVTVMPPLLVEYFRHEPSSARRTRLTELVLTRIGATDSAVALPGTPATPAPGPDSDALLAALIWERARARQLIAGAEWESNPNPGSAVRYLNTLLYSHTNSGLALAMQVFAETDETLGGEEELAEYLVQQAYWLAFAGHMADQALALLQDASARLGRFGRMMNAAEVVILAHLREIPDDYPERLEVTDDLPCAVQLALYEAQMLVLVSRCRFADAKRVYQEVQLLDPQGTRHQPRVLLGHALLGEGAHEQALQLLRSGFEEARGYLDVEAFRAFGAALAACHIHSGNYRDMDKLLDSVFVSTGPSLFPPGTQAALLAVASVTAARRGQASLVERYVADIEQYRLCDGPLPGQSLAWSVSQELILNGCPGEASDQLWAAGEALWARRATFAASLLLLVSLEIAPTDERIQALDEFLSQIPEALVRQAQGKYVVASYRHDPEALSRAARDLEQLGRLGLAVAGYQLAAKWFEESDCNARAEEMRELERGVREGADGNPLDSARFGSYRIVLSEREQEVANLAAQGRTNQEIANQLVISVRTVESHMRRIMRKLDLPNRRALALHLESSSPGGFESNLSETQ
ncbi:LuxR family transcriptional regulator [Leucobacter chromiireducens]|uniref:LuxR family transcriptional regulator n=1 Tax=Leucobacter chromiireducens TaxID=283877 RepID=UPI000F6322C6|nr:LuxR family transcriptional regulator [Leucobacter chromiireducens]